MEVKDSTIPNRIHYGWIVLIMCVLSVFSALGLARFGYTMLLPSMQFGLGLNNTEAGALATGNFIGYLCLALIGGFLASHFGPRKVIAASLFLVGITMILTATSRDFVEALLWRILTGIGSGGSNVPAMGLIAAWFAVRRRGLATGIGVAGSSLGLIITGTLMPIILNQSQENGWRYGWIFLGALVVIISIAAYLLLRNHPNEKGLASIGAEKKNHTLEIGTIPAPLSQRHIFKSWGLIYKSGTVWHLAFIYTMFGFSYIIYVTFFAKYLQAEAGYSKVKAGNLWQFVGWISIFCGVVWGWVSDVLGRKYGLALVNLVQGSAYLIFALWNAPAGHIVSAMMFGITAWSIPAIMAAACGDQLGSRLAPAALGFVTLFFGIGQAFSPTVAGRIADISGSFASAFILATIVAWIGGIFSLFLPQKQEGNA